MAFLASHLIGARLVPVIMDTHRTTYINMDHVRLVEHDHPRRELTFHLDQHKYVAAFTSEAEATIVADRVVEATSRPSFRDVAP